MTGVSTRGAGRASGELAAVLISGAAGASVALLASRQALASVIVRAPSPLPDTVRAVSVQDVRPAATALAVAALASLAAVLASRGVLRRLTGLISVTLGAGLAVIAAGPVTTAAVLAAAGRAGASPASGSGAGTAAGSVTAGNGAAAAGSIGGFPVHVVLGGTGWHVLMIVGAVLIAAAGITVMVRASYLPVMSGRYDRQARRRGTAVEAAGGTMAGSPTTGSATAASTRAGGTTAGGTTAGSMWEALSAGSDPTAGPE